MVKAIIFDLFGVIVTDSLAVIVARLRAEDPVAADRLMDLVNAANKGLITVQERSEQVAAILGITYEQYRQKIADGEARDDQLLAYIRDLRGAYKTAMLSNIGVGSLARRFTGAELDEHFDAVVASGDIGFAKPEAQAYQTTADRLGVRLDECVFTDDREGYCEGARGVGMQAILYRDFAQFRTELEALLAAR